MSHVFISYVRENKAKVMRLCRDLSNQGIDIWLDRNQIAPGEIWRDAIRSAIQDGNFFIACFSDEYQSKRKSFMNEELNLAVEEIRLRQHDRVWFIPVLLNESDVPARDIGAGRTLLDFQWVPLYQDWDEGIKRIVSVVNSDEKQAHKRRIDDLSKEVFRMQSIVYNVDLSPDDEIEDVAEYEEYEEARQKYGDSVAEYESLYLEKYDPRMEEFIRGL